MAELTLRERCQKRLAGLQSIRQPYEEEWREIARNAAPFRSRFLNSETNRHKREANKGMFQGPGIRAARILTGGMTSGLSSPSRPWFKLATYDADLMASQEVKEWLTETERRMYAFLARTNFYSAAKTGYNELGLFGTEACVMLTPEGGRDRERMPAVCYALTAGEYWISTSHAMQPDTLYRRVPMSVNQAMQAFPRDRLSATVRNAYDQGNYEQPVDVFHAIEPNPDAVEGRLDAAGKPWRSVWWDEAEGDREKLLRLSGYDEQPFWAPRWDTTGMDVWGTSPGMEALPDLRELQLQKKRKGEATDLALYPETIVDPKVKLKRQPRSTVSVPSFDQSMVVVPHRVDYQIISAIREDILEVVQAVNEAFYADLFLAITNMQGIQPRNIQEIASRNEEKLTQLGPVIERVNNEKLEVAVERTFGIMSRGELLPPAPEVLQGNALRIEFVSILTQMQRMVGIDQIERTAAFIGGLAAAHPEAADNLSVDDTVKEYADRAGAPANMLRSEDEVAKMRQARAQQQQAAQMAAAMPALKDGADAVRSFGQSQAGGKPLLDRLVQP